MWLHKVKKWMSDESTWICFDPFWSIFEFLSLFRTRCAGDISSTITGRTLFPGHLLHGQTWQNSHVLASLLEKTWTWTHCLMSCRLLVKHNEESPLPPKLLEAQEKADMGSFIVFCCLNCLNAVLWYSSDIIGTLCMFFFFSWFCGMFSSILVMSLFSFFLLFSHESFNPSHFDRWASDHHLGGLRPAKPRNTCRHTWRLWGLETAHRSAVDLESCQHFDFSKEFQFQY